MALSQEVRDRIVSTLKSKTRSKDTEVRRRAATLLTHLKECAEDMIELYIDTVLEGSQMADRQAAAEALTRIGEPAVEPVIDNLVNNPEDDEFGTLMGMQILAQIAVHDEEENKTEGEPEVEDSCSGCPGCSA